MKHNFKMAANLVPSFTLARRWVKLSKETTDLVVASAGHEEKVALATIRLNQARENEERRNRNRQSWMRKVKKANTRLGKANGKRLRTLAKLGPRALQLHQTYEQLRNYEQIEIRTKRQFQVVTLLNQNAYAGTWVIHHLGRYFAELVEEFEAADIPFQVI